MSEAIMALITPVLDDRKFQDIVDEAKKRIPHYCPQWTDHNLSDPGVTLIELFAWMTDIILYRLNQVPDLHYIKFLEMLGINLREPAPAQAPVTFWLSEPQPAAVIIPAGTEVASTQTETQPSIIYTTKRDLQIQNPRWATVVSRVTGDEGKKKYRKHKLRSLQDDYEFVEIFSPVPQLNDAMYFGFENDMSHHILRLDLGCDQEVVVGIDPNRPPYVWEAAVGEEEISWAPCYVESDNTRGMNVAGTIQLHLPKLSKARLAEQELFWVRVRITRDKAQLIDQDGIQPYEISPQLRHVLITTWGGTVLAEHAREVRREFLGRSEGVPGQRFRLQHGPVLRREADEVLVVQSEGEPLQTWHEVSDFAESGADDRHYTLDSIVGEIRFGPAIRQPDGTIKFYGAVPARGSNLIFEKYRYGGGLEGNVQAGILNTLKTSIPYVARVENRFSGWGGLDAETLEDAMVRAPALLRSRQRAVTADDFEFLARQALPATIGRVKCLQPRPADRGRVAPGLVYVLVIPRIPEPGRRIDLQELELGKEDVTALQAFLDERRLLTTQVEVRSPAYQGACVTVALGTVPGAAKAGAEAAVLKKLYSFLNPLIGGPQGKGWPFGRDLYVSDIYQSLQGIPGVQFIRGLELFSANQEGAPEGKPVDYLDLTSHGVIVSGVHTVAIV
jgi:predicted phage baseplate assembly protein